MLHIQRVIVLMFLPLLIVRSHHLIMDLLDRFIFTQVITLLLCAIIVRSLQPAEEDRLIQHTSPISGTLAMGRHQPKNVLIRIHIILIAQTKKVALFPMS
jgi:hypothetical protein